MRYRRLGSAGLLVSEISLGGNTFGRQCDEKATKEIVAGALDVGINFFDTADSYSEGVSEEFLGKALRSQRGRVVLATKTGWPNNDGPNMAGLSRRRIIQAVEASLRRLQTDYVDVFYLHHPDPGTPLDETLRAIDELARSGKIRYLACSNYPAWQVAEMRRVCDLAGYITPVATQSQYNLLDRSVEPELVDACVHYQMGIVCYSPLAGGFLTGKYHRDTPPKSGVRGYENPEWQQTWLTPEHFDMLDNLEALASEWGRPVSQMSLAWLLTRPSVSSVVVGATSPKQVYQNAAVSEEPLMDHQLAALDSSSTLHQG